jgi:hypothetical protein
MSMQDSHFYFPGFFYGVFMPFTVADVEKHKKGLSDSQKRQWVEIANSVLEKCISDGGTESTCDGSAIRQANGAVSSNMQFIIQSKQLKNYSIRNEVHQNKDYLVVPVVMLVEGVHKSINSGPVLHLTEEFSKLPQAWDGIPVTVNHPQGNDGDYISANTPQIIDDETIGIIYNTNIENGKLKAEAWIEKEKTEKLYPELLNTILNGKPLEVSTGSFTEYEDSQGQQAGESYEAIARNYTPNHLALLPNAIGACSWSDGCGIRPNKGGEKLKRNEKILKAIKALSGVGLAVNEIGFRETSSKIQQKLDAMDTDTKFHNLQEVFDDEFIFSVFTQTEENLFKRGYTVNADETIEFTGEPTPVTRIVDFKEVTTNKGEVVNAMSKDTKSKSCCPAKVTLLVQSGRFDESDKEWLDNLKEGALDKLLSDKDKIQINRESALKLLKDDLSSPEKLVSVLSGDAKSIVEHGLELNQKERTGLIEHITANAAGEGGLSKEELEAKDTKELKKLAIMFKAPSDFTGLNSGNPTINAVDDEMLLPVAPRTGQQKTQ